MLAIYRQYQFPCKEKQKVFFLHEIDPVFAKSKSKYILCFFTCFFGLEVGVNNYFHHLASVTLHSGLFCDCPLLFNQQN